MAGNRIDNFAAPGSMLKQPKEPKVKAFRKVSNKPVKPIRARNPNSAASRREGMSKEYTYLILALPCIIPGCRQPAENHHLKSGAAAAERGAGLKATDKWQVPLCAGHHRLGPNCVESCAPRWEPKWFAERGVPDVLATAARMWSAFKAGGGLDGMLQAMRGAPQVHSNLASIEKDGTK